MGRGPEVSDGSGGMAFSVDVLLYVERIPEVADGSGGMDLSLCCCPLGRMVWTAPIGCTNVLLVTICFFRDEEWPTTLCWCWFFSGAGSILKMPEDVFLVAVGVASGFFAVKDNVTAAA